MQIHLEAKLNKTKIKPLSKEYLESIGLFWHTDSDKTDYISDEILNITQEEANSYYEATNELYEMFVKSAEYVIQNNLFHELNIPYNLVDAIKISWENEANWHLYGRFDFAGGINNIPIKLIEFNADTPTSLYETAIIQWAMLKQNGFDEDMQFNSLHESLIANFKRLITLEESVEDFQKYYDGYKILFSSIRGNVEEENTVRFMQHLASEAGFKTDFAYIDEVGFSDELGIFKNEENFEYWFKLIPWETIAIDEGELALTLTSIIQNKKAIILNPPYTLLFQSKGIMKILWDLFPNHPLLLQSQYEPIANKKYVAKPFFGREGANVQIVDENGKMVCKNGGEYANFKTLYQEFATFAQDENQTNYQAGVFFAYEGCGLGFRKGGLILDNMSKFVGHRII